MGHLMPQKQLCPAFVLKSTKMHGQKLQDNGPFSPGGHVESQENKKLCFYMPSLALNLCLGEAWCTRLFS